MPNHNPQTVVQLHLCPPNNLNYNQTVVAYLASLLETISKSRPITVTPDLVTWLDSHGRRHGLASTGSRWFPFGDLPTVGVLTTPDPYELGSFPNFADKLVAATNDMPIHTGIARNIIGDHKHPYVAIDRISHGNFPTLHMSPEMVLTESYEWPLHPQDQPKRQENH